MSVGVSVHTHTYTYIHTERIYNGYYTHSAYRESVFSLTKRHRECVRDKTKMNVAHRVLCGDYTYRPF